MTSNIPTLFQQIIATTIGEGQTFMANTNEFLKLCEEDRRAKEAQEGEMEE